MVWSGALLRIERSLGLIDRTRSDAKKQTLRLSIIDVRECVVARIDCGVPGVPQYSQMNWSPKYDRATTAHSLPDKPTDATSKS